jgi:preprotein translocase subunit SecE
MARASNGVTRPAIGKAARAAAERSAVRQGRAPQARRLPQVLQNAEQFFRDVVAELNRVSWPDRQTLIASSLVVVFVLTVTSLYLGAADLIFAKLFERFLRP